MESLAVALAVALTDHLGGLMLVGAAVAFYVASRAAADALSAGGAVTGAISPVRHALAQWAGIVAVCLVAVWLDHAEIAVAVIFSTSVGVLSLHLGVAVASIPHARRPGHGFEILDPHAAASHDVVAAPSPQDASHPRAQQAASRSWAMVLPVGVLALMAGFSGKLTLLHAALFAAQGLLVTLVWDGGRAGAHPAPVVRLSPTRRAQLVLALALAFIGAVCAVYGAGRMSEETKIMPTGLIGAAAIGPLLVLPMIGSASHLAAHGNAQTATGASVVIVLLNVCLLLPVVIAGWHVREQFVPPVAEAVAPAPPPAATTAPATTQSVADDEFGEDEPVVIADDFPRVLTFPVAVWRIDAVLLILLGLMLLPVSLNLWDMRRTEGFLLIVIYACYLIATTFLGRRW